MEEWFTGHFRYILRDIILLEMTEIREIWKGGYAGIGKKIF